MNTFGFDANKGITKIEYDLLGNPKKISFADRSYIDYVYSADGRRIKTRHFTAVPSSATLSLGQASTLTSSQIQSVDSTEYIGNFVFENNTFKQYHFDGGYITSSGFPTNYKYYVKDHLGNNRILASYNGTVEQTNHYYPFGSTHHFSSNQGVQKYKYNGKELDTMHGLNMYDYGARQYDSAIGQFSTMDPLCEKYYHISPYAYCGGNPVNRVDIDGKDIYTFDVNGYYVDRKTHDIDIVQVQDVDGNYTQIELSKGAIINCENKISKDGFEYTLLEISGRENSVAAFEHLGWKNEVEWTHVVTGENTNNFLSTGHGKNKEPGVNILLSETENLKGYSISRIDHNHPNESPKASGYKNDVNYISGIVKEAGTYGDIGFAVYLMEFHPYVSFNIYLPASDKYVNYNDQADLYYYKKAFNKKW